MSACDCASRRQLLKRAIGLGVGLGLVPRRSLGQDDRASLRARAGDLFVKVDDAAMTPVTPGDIVPGAAQTMAWPMDPTDRTVRSGSRLNRVMLVRLDPGTLSADTLQRAADGVVAYTAICTHTGCEVIDWNATDRLLRCPCHLTAFDPKDGARVVEGPAPRALPALPLTVAGGNLVVAQPFTSRVGFD